MAIVATGYVRVNVLTDSLANKIKAAVQKGMDDAEKDLHESGRTAGDEST